MPPLQPPPPQQQQQQQQQQLLQCAMAYITTNSVIHLIVVYADLVKARIDIDAEATTAAATTAAAAAAAAAAMTMTSSTTHLTLGTTAAPPRTHTSIGS
ncbi:hypothetical protein AWZ03_012250 [Drosophila navojoa]|uniref:Uncharacterized protein n=1 Tax=Drosophila navojoa TaxID=7232 RepID=A0A484AXJ8_DRONA|nr:hypothetical protein AWZ03_012250 [Drosophila navojoa]